MFSRRRQTTSEAKESSKAPAAMEHVEQELRELRAPSAPVIARVVRDAIADHMQAERDAEALIASIQADLLRDYYAFIALHQGTPSFEALAREKRSLLNMSAGETEDGGHE